METTNTTNSPTTELQLEAELSEEAAALSLDADFLFELTGALGTPLNVVFPDRMRVNVERFQSVLERHMIDGDLLFAHKANRSRALVRALETTDAAMDVASLEELRQAAGAGFRPERISAGGPKTPEFLWLALRLGVTVIVDSFSELETITALAQRTSTPVRIAVRLSAFEVPGVLVRSRPSRFGISHGRFAEVINHLTKHRDILDAQGVAFHLDTVAIDEKAMAIDASITALDAMRAAGLDPQYVNIGGGFKVNYLRHGDQWERYTQRLRAAVLGEAPSITWGGDGLGLRNSGGAIAGGLAVYGFHEPVAADRFLDRLLSQIAPSFQRPIGVVLAENLYRLQVEPGRALLDQAGVTVTRVLDRWTTPSGDRLVRLDMNRQDIGDTELLIDPIIISRNRTTAASASGVYFVGNLCMESDFVTRRQVFLPVDPEVGDLVLFPNTAGYFMDFTATQAIQHPIARKVACWRTNDVWNWCLDEEYSPVRRLS